MQKVNSVWAIIYIEVDEASTDKHDWNVDSSLFANKSDAYDFANKLSQIDFMNVYDIMELFVYENGIDIVS